MRVSVIVPCYNYGRFLPETLDSVLAQTFSDWECVVVDDGSTDDSREVARRYAERDPRIRLIELQHVGVSGARNAGIRATTAEYLQFLDSDDLLVPEKLELQTRFFAEHPESDVVYGNVAYFRTGAPQQLMCSREGKLSRPILDDRLHGAETAARKFELYNFFHPCAALARRRIVERAGLFCGEAAPCEDHELWLACSILGGRFDHIERDEPVALIRTHPASASHQPGRTLRGLMGAARAFAARPAAAAWTSAMLPLIYEVAAGVGEGEAGHGIRAFKRIRAAARRSPEALTRWRWNAYALGALVLPRKLVFRFAAMPIPEEALEAYRRLRRLVSGKARTSR
jgi:glycosyltransferase involved in cell wall biosynthesis